jgi:Flp pilus assembly protein TadG
MNRLRPRRDDRGSVSVELVILAPLFGLLLLGVVAVGRVQQAHADVDAAARMAARDLSIARDPYGRLHTVQQRVAAMLDVGSPSCRAMAFDAEIGDTRIDVTVACNAELQEAALLPVPGSMTVTGTATEIRDAYRETAA